MSISKALFDTMPDGREIFAYTMTNRTGVSATVLNYGGIIQKLLVPDHTGKPADCVCGYDDLRGYQVGGYHGALIGRYANRIAAGKFTLGGKSYQVAKNERGVTHLHGGDVGFDQKLWDVCAEEGAESDRLTLTYTAPDGEEGYPGTLTVKATYTLCGSRLTLRFQATTDAETVCSLTNHSYFNMGGIDSGDILGQVLTIDSDEILAMDSDFIPTEIMPVEGTPFDFRRGKKVGEEINADHIQLQYGNGYDHNFILRQDKPAPNAPMQRAAELYDPESGRVMTVYTNFPGVQLYTANGMDLPHPFKGGCPQQVRHALCLETQLWPDSPNHPDYPSCVLKPGEVFDYSTAWEFSCR